MLPNIAPAPPPQGQQQQPMAPQAGAAGQPGQIAAAPAPGQPGMPQQMAQMGQALPQGQFIINPQTFGANGATAQFPMAQFATYNQQGQLVVQQMPIQMAASQQPGQQQQILFTNMAAQQQQQQQQQQPQQQQIKPGQPMMVPNNQATPGKSIQVPAASIAGNGTLVASSAGGQPQTFMIANPMGASQPGTPTTSVSNQMKQLQPLTPDQKGVITSIANTSTQQQLPQMPSAPSTAQTPQPFVMPQGMTYVSQGQTILQGNQRILIAPAPQDPNNPQAAPIMFSPPAPNQSPIQAQQAQQMQPQNNPQIAAQSLQPMTMARPQMATFQPVGQSPKAGKTPISRALPQIRPGFSNAGPMPGQLQPQLQQVQAPQQPSPKSKTKMSPRTGGPIGRPPGPTKASLNTLKTPMVASPMAPPRLPVSVVASMSNPIMAGTPPVLQTTPAILPPPIAAQGQPGNNQFSGPPKLQPMLPAPPASSEPSDVKMKVEEADDKESSSSGDADSKSSASAADTPKAVVKPNVLTHVIDGHVIMESSQPFPVDKEDKAGKVQPLSFMELTFSCQTLIVHCSNLVVAWVDCMLFEKGCWRVLRCTLERPLFWSFLFIQLPAATSSRPRLLLLAA